MRLPLLCLSLISFSGFAEPINLSLKQAEDRLVLHNREILAARRAVEGATTGVTIAGQAPNPGISYSTASISPGSGIGTGALRDKRMDQIIALSQLIERGDKQELRTAVAEAAVRAAHADLADIRRQQRLAVHFAYYDLKAAIEREKLTGETASLYRKSLDVLELRQKAGDVAAVDVSRLRIEMLRAQNEARGALAEVARTRRALAYLIGFETHAEDLIADDLWPQLSDPTLESGSLGHRADMRAAAARVDTAGHARDLARSLAVRDVTVGAQIERNMAGAAPAGGVTYGVSLSFPIFARYGFGGEIARSENDYAAALEARAKILAQAELETERARTDYLAARDRLRRIESELLPSTRQVADAAEFAYVKGGMGLIDLLDARRTLRAVELDAVAARAEHAKAGAAWLAATEWETTPQP